MKKAAGYIYYGIVGIMGIGAILAPIVFLIGILSGLPIVTGQ